MKLRNPRLAGRFYVAGVLLIHLLVIWNARDLIWKGYPDFTIYYTAGTIVREGMGHALYDDAVQFRVQKAFAPQVATRLGALPFNHPPFEAVLFVPLSYFPYRVAYLLWSVVNLAMLAGLPILLRPHVPVLNGWRPWVWTVASLAFFPIFFSLLQGQDAILLLFLYGLAFVSWKEQRLVVAGAWLACGMFKFHLVLPFVLLMLIQEKTAQGRRKILTGFVGVGVILGAVSIAAVGVRQILSYPGYVLGLEKTMAMGAIMPSDMPNLRGILYLMASGVRHFDVVVICLSAGLYFLAAWICGSPDDDSLDYDSNDATRDLKFSLAVFATVLVSYHGLGYDLCVLALPVLLVAGQLGHKIRWASWTGMGISAGLAALLFSPLPLVLLMRYNRLALLGWALLLCFVSLAGELRSRPLRI
ncbi:MAG: glycosyltransferase family 87 protein [Candidatus Sulfotelmatobacter sp.]